VKRALRPRATEALGVVPVTVTDRTAPAVLGLEPRTFRELVARLGVPHVTLGRRIVVPVAAMLEALEGAAVDPAPRSGAAERDAADDDGEVSVDGILAELGRRRRA
jgi:hypothetical protein